MNGPHDELYEFHPYHNFRAKKQCRFARAPDKSDPLDCGVTALPLRSRGTLGKAMIK
jgi:hypothetical protein